MSVNQKDNTPLRRRFSFGAIGTLLLLSGLFSVGSAQQEGYQLTQYMFNPYSYNAGTAGMSNGINLSLLHRQQDFGWGKGTEDKNIWPNSTILLADMPIKAIKGAVGLEVAAFNAAQYRDIFVKLGYTYHLQTHFGLIGMGVRAQIESMNLDFSKFDKDVVSKDPLLKDKEKNSGAVFGDVGLGFYLQGNENYTIGIGFNNLVAHKSGKIAHRPSRILVVHGDYHFHFTSLPKVEFSPSTYLETNFHTVNWMIAVTGTFNRRFWAGLAYRLQDAVCIMAGVNIAKFQIGAAYDITASPLIRGSKIGGSFEIMARYCFGLEGEKVNTEYKNARYL